MGIVTRYFGPSSSGTGNGTTWADRAALVPSGAWSTIVSGFNFAADSLICLIEPATYTIPLITFTSTAPNTVGRLSFVAAPSGVRWTPPDPDWNCCQPIWDISQMVTWNTSVTIYNSATNGLFVDLWGIRVLETGATISHQNFTLNWCEMRNSHNNGSSYANYQGDCTNCVIQFTGTQYYACDYTPGSRMYRNNRVIGNLSANSGLRAGVFITSPSARFQDVCIINTLVGVANGTGANHIGAANCTFINCTTGIQDRSGTTASAAILRCLFHGSTTGYSSTDVTKNKVITDNLFNSVTTPTSGNTNWDNVGLNLSDTLSTTDLFVDPVAGDYRIKYGNAYWGKGIGAGDGPIPPDVVAAAIWTRPGRSLT